MSLKDLRDIFIHFDVIYIIYGTVYVRSQRQVDVACLSLRARPPRCNPLPYHLVKADLACSLVKAKHTKFLKTQTCRSLNILVDKLAETIITCNKMSIVFIQWPNVVLILFFFIFVLFIQETFKTSSYKHWQHIQLLQNTFLKFIHSQNKCIFFHRHKVDNHYWSRFTIIFPTSVEWLQCNFKIVLIKTYLAESEKNFYKNF